MRSVSERWRVDGQKLSRRREGRLLLLVGAYCTLFWNGLELSELCYPVLILGILGLDKVFVLRAPYSSPCIVQ